MTNLDVLTELSNRDAILLAEAIGWLHDYRKCNDEFLSRRELARAELLNKFPALSGVAISLLSAVEPVVRLLNERRRRLDDDSASPLIQFLSRCHNTAHFDKQEPVSGEQSLELKLSTPFGYEKSSPNSLTSELWGLPWGLLTSYSANQDLNRDHLRQRLSTLFSQTLADTRRPINEVDLWSWGLLVGALYKAALAGALLEGPTRAVRDLRWRLLSIRVNGLDFLLNVARVPDLLARQQLLSDSLGRVRRLLESTYPLGSEVYRDENGSIHVVPDVGDLLERTNSSGTNLRTLILQEFASGTLYNSSASQMGGEMTPYLALEGTPWWGQDPDWDPERPDSSRDEIPGIGNIISQPVLSPPAAGKFEQIWESGIQADICSVCGLRPQGPTRKAAERKVCDTCEIRRADRSKEWSGSGSDRTIWIDEVADINGRLALIVGHYDLSHWLDGGLLASLFSIAPGDDANTAGKPITTKTASFSRLRRVWETTQGFWQEVQEHTLRLLSDDRRRLKIYLGTTPRLGPYHVYDLELDGTNLSVVWVPSNDGGYLITAANLGCVASQLGAAAGEYSHSAAAAIFVEDYLRTQFITSGREPVLRNPDTYTGRTSVNHLSGARIVGSDFQEDRYATAIPVLAEPQSFMILVPADKSMQVIRDIKRKYECEAGKVRDRLPIHVGAIYARRSTPLRSLLEAGRAMLARRVPEQQWVVKSANRQTVVDAYQFNETSVIGLDTGDRLITWRVPLKMGDGTTADIWYPYVFLKTSGDDRGMDDRNRRCARLQRRTEGGGTQDGWVVHAGDLRAGDTIYVRPSTFDFEYLDAAGRRFDIHYDESGRRARRTRPFYLEDLDRLDELWNLIRRLAVSQRHQIIHAIEATREQWYGGRDGDEAMKDGAFRQLVSDTLAVAAWPKGQGWSVMQKQQQARLIEAGVRGELFDLADLHMEILKER